MNFVKYSLTFLFFTKKSPNSCPVRTLLVHSFVQDRFATVVTSLKLHWNVLLLYVNLFFDKKQPSKRTLPCNLLYLCILYYIINLSIRQQKTQSADKLLIVMLFTFYNAKRVRNFTELSLQTHLQVFPLKLFLFTYNP